MNGINAELTLVTSKLIHSFALVQAIYTHWTLTLTLVLLLHLFHFGQILPNTLKRTHTHTIYIIIQKQSREKSFIVWIFSWWLPCLYLPALRCARNGQSKDGIRVTVTVAGICITTAIAWSPDKYRTFAFAATGHAIDECTSSQWSGSINSGTIVLWSPRSTVNVNVLRI